MAGGFISALQDMPTMLIGKGTGKVKRQIDAAGLAVILRDSSMGFRDETIVIVEKVSSMPGQGVSSVFSLGDSFGVIRGVCAALRLPVHFVAPATWKKHFGLGSDKEEARARAINLFPDASLARKKDHGRAEAILIALYGSRKLV
jgi:crossover junction endodeoxyribonuclease RuvC